MSLWFIQDYQLKIATAFEWNPAASIIEQLEMGSLRRITETGCYVFRAIHIYTGVFPAKRIVD
jgi:hypothetical protein